MGWRFHRGLSIIPGVKLNLSKGGVSSTVGVRGAGVNIGRHGVTTDAGIPGTGLSYREKMGRHGSWMGIVTVVAGLGLWAFNHQSKIEKWLGGHQPAPAATATATAAAPAPHVAHVSSAADSVIAAATPAQGARYVRRNNSDLRAVPSASSPAIAKEARGAAVTLLAVDGAWSKVSAGGRTGWMRSSVLGTEAP
ncbi:MAG TPA: DUF4236 domain-containing protein [Rhizomicrobium sp.]|jgi:hypothetical protein|nr:DUF4236 domain-containing protein [Rhizomicrobium sp.]